MVTTSSPLQELADVIEAEGSAEMFSLSAGFTLPDGREATVVLQGSPIQGPMEWSFWSPSAVGKSSLPSRLNRVDAAIRQFAAQYPDAVIRPGSIHVRAFRARTSSVKLAQLFEQAWHEAYGLPIPSKDDFARRRKQEREARQSGIDDTVALLATGAAGVAEFNRRPPEERATARLRKVDLSGLALDGVEFGGADLEAADFTGASLAGAVFLGGSASLAVAMAHGGSASGRLVKARLAGANLAGANLTGCRCADADFRGADLSRAEASATSFLRAGFVDARLDGARLQYADLRGADFTGASLGGADFEGATFDDATKWPKKFKPPANLVWKGGGPDPRTAPAHGKKAHARPTDFPGFLDRLKAVADAAKLDKALAMLKADRFRLFARVEGDHLIGVVKSQSDGSLVYSCRLDADGSYGCCTQNLFICGGLRGSPCKHLLVLLVGLTQAGELEPATAHDWTQASRGQKPAIDKDAMAETLLRFKGAEAGEVDWRPTETIPEDFYV